MVSGQSLKINNTTAIDDFNEYEVTAINSNTLTIRLKDDATGRGLQNAIADDSFIKRRWRYYDLFLEEQENSDGAGPGSSQFAIDNGRAKGDQLFIVVYDIDGKLSGFAGGRMTNPQTGASKTHRLSSVLETHVGSKNPKAKTPEGASLYYPNIVYRNSKFVYWGDHRILAQIGVQILIMKVIWFLMEQTLLPPTLGIILTSTAQTHRLLTLVTTFFWKKPHLSMS